MSEEVRVVDPRTGGEKGRKLQYFHLIPTPFLWALAQHYGIGAQKYAPRNWERGYAWSLSYDAMQRHIHQWVMGESIDEETGSHHLVAAAWHCICLFMFERWGRGTDDLRPQMIETGLSVKTRACCESSESTDLHRTHPESARGE
jgi:hypothetical protein